MALFGTDWVTLMKQFLSVVMLVMFLLVGVSHAVGAENSRKKTGGLITQEDSASYMSYTQMAQQLVQEFPNADPMILEHAQGLVAGEPGKSWKNCVLQDTLQAHLDAQVRQSTLAAE